ncbi:MAG: carboxypeptidase-like regulatory domain-containing protein [Bacteroidales bacterium]|nr:carboxypeptidase-like regulatory domain-containing protein [Bacteroidales bacterium]
MVYPVYCFSQYKITGVVFDKETNKPVDCATIYINGTTLGTLSDQNGVFQINSALFPANIIVSHLSYKTKSIAIERNEEVIHLQIELEPSNFVLPEVKIYRKNDRLKI